MTLVQTCKAKLKGYDGRGLDAIIFCTDSLQTGLPNKITQKIHPVGKYVVTGAGSTPIILAAVDIVAQYVASQEVGDLDSLMSNLGRKLKRRGEFKDKQRRAEIIVSGPSHYYKRGKWQYRVSARLLDVDELREGVDSCHYVGNRAIGSGTNSIDDNLLLVHGDEVSDPALAFLKLYEAARVAEGKDGVDGNRQWAIQACTEYGGVEVKALYPECVTLDMPGSSAMRARLFFGSAYRMESYRSLYDLERVRMIPADIEWFYANLEEQLNLTLASFVKYCETKSQYSMKGFKGELSLLRMIVNDMWNGHFGYSKEAVI